MSHTPGTYRQVGVYLTHNHPDRFWEAPVFSGDKIVGRGIGATEKEAERNGNLFACAPTLIEAVRLWLTEWEETTDDIRRDNREFARKIYARATGT